MKWLDRDATAAAIDRGALVAALDEMLAARAAGRVECPNRTALGLPGGGTLLSMLACDGRHALAKLISVNPENPRHGLPRLQSRAMLYEAATGRPLAEFDGDVLTARRTAALSVCAARRLAAGTERVLVVGAGVQAQAHAEAFLASGRCAELVVQARRTEAASDLVARLAASPLAGSARVRVATTLAAEIPAADVIVTATNSLTPVLPDHVADGTLTCAVGAFTPAMAEVPAALVRRSRVVVDDLDACRVEAGDLLQAGIDWEEVEQIGGERRQRTADRPILFKSVGCALWDLAAATCAWQASAGAQS